MGFFSNRGEAPTTDSAAAAADEFVITGEDIAECGKLLAAFDAAQSDLDAPDDSNIRAAIRSIAEAGSGMPLSSWMPLTMTGDQASERAWRWLAACARSAVASDNSVLPITLAVFAIAWDEIAPGPTSADPVELGLLRAPPPVFAEIVARAILSAENVAADFPIWHAPGKLITAGVAQRGHARVLLELDGKGQPVDERAKAVAIRLAVRHA